MTPNTNAKDSTASSTYTAATDSTVTTTTSNGTFTSLEMTALELLPPPPSSANNSRLPPQMLRRGNILDQPQSNRLNSISSPNNIKHHFSSSISAFPAPPKKLGGGGGAAPNFSSLAGGGGGGEVSVGRGLRDRILVIQQKNSSSSSDGASSVIAPSTHTHVTHTVPSSISSTVLAAAQQQALPTDAGGGDTYQNEVSRRSRYRNTRVLVTGATGFIGSHCIKRLLERGYRVRGTVRDISKRNLIEPLYMLSRKRRDQLELVEAELLDKHSWTAAVAGCDYVVHVASPVPLAEPEDRFDVIRQAVQGTLNVLEACRDSECVRKVVMTGSSVAMYDSFNPPQRRRRAAAAGASAGGATGLAALQRQRNSNSGASITGLLYNNSGDEAGTNASAAGLLQRSHSHNYLQPTNSTKNSSNNKTTSAHSPLSKNNKNNKNSRTSGSTSGGSNSSTKRGGSLRQNNNNNSRHNNHQYNRYPDYYGVGGREDSVDRDDDDENEEENSSSHSGDAADGTTTAAGGAPAAGRGGGGGGVGAISNRALKKRVKQLAALAYKGKVDGKPHDEDEWTDLDDGRWHMAYVESKVRAEKTAWDFYYNLPADKRARFEFTVIAPTITLGPVLHGRDGSSLIFMLYLLTSGSPFMPHMGIETCDVRDVAEAHARALEMDSANEKRIVIYTQTMWYSEIADVIKREFGPLGYNVPSIKPPAWLMRTMARFSPQLRLIVSRLNRFPKWSSARMRQDLELEARVIDVSIIDMMHSLIQRGDVKMTRRYREWLERNPHAVFFPRSESNV